MRACLCAASIFMTMKNGVCSHILLPLFQDEKLRKLVDQHGTDSWKSIAYHFPVCLWFNLHSVFLTAAHGVGRGDRKVSRGPGMMCSALCGCVSGEDRWPVSAPLAEGAQP